MKIIFTITIIILYQSSFAQLLEYKSRNRNLSPKKETAFVKVKDFSKEFSNITNYEIKRIKIDSLSFSRRIFLLDSVNKVLFEKYAIHKGEKVDLSAETLYKKDSISTLWLINYYQLKDSLNKVNLVWKNTKASIKLLSESKTKQDTILAKSKIYEGFSPLEKTLDNIEKTINNQSQKLSNEIEKLLNEEVEKNRMVAFLPDISTFFGKAGFLAPSINLLGTQDFTNGAMSGTIKIFSTSLPSKEKIDWRTLATQQTSEFGITADFIGGFRKTETAKVQNLGIRFGTSYLVKRGLENSGMRDTTYNFSIFHTHLGLEFIAFPKVLSFYADYNLQLIATNLTIIKSRFYQLDDVKNNLGFYNTGVKFRINPTGALSQNLKKYPIIIDLNFIWVSNQFAILDSKGTGEQKDRISGDKVIPNIRVSLKM
jgi:hypothetical protein